MDGDAVRRIEELAEKAAVKVKDGVTYVSGNYKPLGVVHEDCLRFTALEDFCVFVNENPQKQDLRDAVIMVNPDFTVSLLSKPDPLDGERTVIALAKRHETEGFQFARQLDVDAFIVALKSKFVKADSDWETVFNLVRKVQIEDGVELSDDGMSQKVTIKKGVSAASVETVNKPVDYALRPYRIFPECEQPKSVFFMRLQASGSMGVYVSLYETDGGAWKNDAARIIREYIEVRLNDETRVPVFC